MRHQIAPRSTAPTPELAPTGRGPARAPRGGARGRDGGAAGPTGQEWLDGALAAAFSADLSGIDASFGEASENEALGARAHTAGHAMSFGAGVRPDAQDPASLGTIAHEVAHALAGGGSGRTALAHDGDRGEATAEQAGASFARWAGQGFAGPAPRLRAATGGEGAIHREPDGPARLTGSPTLQRGSRGGQVSLLQSLLRGAGFSVAVDGDFGLQTHRAVRAFQAENRLFVDGVVGPRTAEALNRHARSPSPAAGGGGAPAPAGPATGGLTGVPALRDGSAGAAVRTLQSLLNNHGARLEIDGEFGPVTAGVVRAFQQANGLGVDGVVGPATARALTSGTARRIGSGDVAAGGGAGGAPRATVEPAGADAWRDRVIEAASGHLGKRYWWGADGPAYFDCSGFVLYVLRNETGLVNWGDDTAAGISNRLPRTSDPRKGDLVFFWRGGSIEHVEIVTGNGSGTIGASGGGSRTRGDNPNARVKWGDWSGDRRSKTFGSISGLIGNKLRSGRS
jgi:peptidoglycan hydrolase-like protein with peptidoglycan-binding domain